ncbi:MAG: ABC transporter ATP-binding protein [Gemmatimonadaceae bacterium]|jgi:ABC-type multidrug transport system ATPase subunit|nr:ABC transporter ATP-binding protein [Gemmatimonadaceae bacterium]
MLTVSDLHVRYPGDVHALRGVSLTVAPGLFGLLGPNGAGKSTLMRTLATLQMPSSGSISFHGTDIAADPAAHRRRLGYLPQDFGVYPGISALVLLEHLAVLKGLTDRTERREQVHALLAQVNLWSHRHQAVSRFSGGMRQRFGVAQALLGDPQLLIVDEPTAGLDPVERTRFYNLLAEIGDSVVVLLSTHIVEDVRQLCSRLAILHDGAIVREGSPDDLIRELEDRIFTSTVPRGTTPPVITAPQRLLSTQRVAGAIRLRVLGDVAPSSDFTRVAPDLEDVYLSALTAERAMPVVRT